MDCDILSILKIMNEVSNDFVYSEKQKAIIYRDYLYDPISGDLFFKSRNNKCLLEYHPNYRDVAQEILLHCYDDDLVDRAVSYQYPNEK